MNLIRWFLLIWVTMGFVGGILYIPDFKRSQNRLKKSSDITIGFWISSIVFGVLVLFRVLLGKYLEYKLRKLEKNDNNNLV